jgi:hypothetical protein
MSDFVNQSIPDERGEIDANLMREQSTPSSSLPPMRNVKDLVTVLGQMP